MGSRTDNLTSRLGQKSDFALILFRSPLGARNGCTWRMSVLLFQYSSPRSSLGSSKEEVVGIFPGGVCYFPSSFQKQEKQCPDRDDTERTRPVTTPSVPFSHDLRPPFVPFEHANATYDAPRTYISDDVALFWHPPSVFSQWTLSPFTVDLVEYNCAEQFMMASKARLFGDDTALSAILASDGPREQKRIGRHVRHFDHDFLQQNSPKTIKCVWPSCTLCLRRLAETSPHDILWGIGLSACDPESTNASTVMCATLATTSYKKIANISSREATLRHSHKKMRYTLPLDILANAASPKLAPMINCSVSV